MSFMNAELSQNRPVMCDLCLLNVQPLEKCKTGGWVIRWGRKRNVEHICPDCQCPKPCDQA